MTESDRDTLITLRIRWDAETEDHPAGWGWDVLLDRLEPVEVVSFADVEQGVQSLDRVIEGK